METKILRTEEDAIEFFKSLSPELVNNPQFRSIVGYEIGRHLYEGSYISASKSDDGKAARFIPDPKVIREPNLPRSDMQALEVKTFGPNGDHMEVIWSKGTLYDADAYYRSRQNRPYYDYDSVLDTLYSRYLYDPEGIEIQHSTYSKMGWGLINAGYDDTEKFRYQLLSNGDHKPSLWGGHGPELPQFHEGALVTGVIRQNNPAFAEVFSYNVGPGQGIINRIDGLAYVHSVHPERLIVDDYSVYATFVNGKYEVKDPYHVYEGMSLSEIEKQISLNYEDYLDHSKTKEQDQRTYGVLKERLAQANQKYTDQMTNDQGRHM